MIFIGLIAIINTLLFMAYEKRRLKKEWIMLYFSFLIMTVAALWVHEHDIGSFFRDVLFPMRIILLWVVVIECISRFCYKLEGQSYDQ